MKGHLPIKTSFSLGRWAGPVRWIALIWSVFVVGELVIPTANQQTALMAGVFFVFAGVWYVLILRHRLNRGEAGVPRSVEEQPVLVPSEAPTA